MADERLSLGKGLEILTDLYGDIDRRIARLEDITYSEEKELFLKFVGPPDTGRKRREE